MNRCWIAASLLVLSGAALADWQYTKWGMTPEQVVAASSGNAKKVKDKKEFRVGSNRRLVLGSVDLGKTRFSVEFYFTAEKLTFLRLVKPDSMTCEEQESLVVSIYGDAPPSDRTVFLPSAQGSQKPVKLEIRNRTWPNEAGNRMTLNQVRSSDDAPLICVVTIEPLKSGVS